MNEEIVRKLAQDGVSLIITCDCGISNVREITLAKELGWMWCLPTIIPFRRTSSCRCHIKSQAFGRGHRARNISGCGMVYFYALPCLRKGLS